METEFDATSAVRNVSASFSEEILRGAILAMLVSFLLITIYIAAPLPVAVRGADPAHDRERRPDRDRDLLASGREVTAATVAAFLTIIGYSIYDTIIIFDRVRENLPLMRRSTVKEIVNVSLWETVRRSVATTIIVLLPGRRAVLLRRRDAPGLRVRDPDRDLDQRLLDDLHRRAVPGRPARARSRVQAAPGHAARTALAARRRTPGGRRCRSSRPQVERGGADDGGGRAGGPRRRRNARAAACGERAPQRSASAAASAAAQGRMAAPASRRRPRRASPPSSPPRATSASTRRGRWSTSSLTAGAATSSARASGWARPPTASSTSSGS